MERITKEQIGSYEEAIELAKQNDQADTREFSALKREYRKAKRLYRLQQRRAGK